ncbi:MAG TPA: MutS family DNA mismatch repair protein, partial [Puia sp.]|nr:MutS family DNA mismatch repair protein [Puia sp.]
QTEKKLIHWLKQENIFSRKIVWKITRYIYPFISVGCVVLFMYDIIQPSLFYPLLLFFFIFSGAISKKISPEYNQINKIEPEIDTLYNSVAWIEKQKWQSLYLLQLQKKFATSDVTASSAIRKFKKILDRFDMRLNFVLFIPLNIFFLWDLQIVFQLESWRDRFSKVMSGWFFALGEAEAINSLAILKYNHPGWVFPVFDTKNKGTLSAKDLGHPLIPLDKCVRNSFSTENIGQVALITGSNMAGKSTFLRSVGVNIILAMMGSPVDASLMTLSPVSVISSMRITDNLEESTSTFYAELKKLKHIIECCNRHENVFLLLDEILRGTNSLDRHTGSVALLRQLLKQDAVGILATHDLELAQLANEFPVNIHNYHFDVSVQNDELFFDYKLKDGICQSMNATILMKKIGIDL